MSAGNFLLASGTATINQNNQPGWNLNQGVGPRFFVLLPVLGWASRKRQFSLFLPSPHLMREGRPLILSSE
jgi:hypothetical protein